MSMYPDSQAQRYELEYGTDNKAVFNFFNAVYAWMAVGLAVTAGVAWGVSQSPKLLSILFMSKFMVVALLLGAWAIAWGVQKAAQSISAVAATLLFMLYAAVIGALISGIFLVYPIATIGSAFLITGGTFGAMSLYGFITKRDLSSIGSYLVMGAFGLFFASIVNVFMANNALSWIITYGVLAVFIGLTAYETQKLKQFAYDHADNADLASRMAIIGSLVLYVAFINMFMAILRILGSRK
jgi:FtsH-binding integral membrane protein